VGQVSFFRGYTALGKIKGFIILMVFGLKTLANAIAHPVAAVKSIASNPVAKLVGKGAVAAGKAIGKGASYAVHHPLNALGKVASVALPVAAAAALGPVAAEASPASAELLGSKFPQLAKMIPSIGKKIGRLGAGALAARAVGGIGAAIKNHQKAGTIVKNAGKEAIDAGTAYAKNI